MRALRLLLLLPLLLAAPHAVAQGAAPSTPEAVAVSPAPAPVAAGSAAAGPDAAAPVAQNGENVRVEAPSSEITFAAGSHVEARAAIGDDLVLAGRNVIVDGARADHLFLAGGDVDLAPEQVEDIFLVGGNVRLRSGLIVDDVVIAAGQARTAREARVGGSMIVAGGDVRLEAPIGASLLAAGERLELNGPVAGHAALTGQSVVIGPNARIGGDLRVRAEEITISPQAVIGGRTIREEIPRGRREAAARGAAVIFAVLGGLFLIGIFALHAFVAAMAPGVLQGAAVRLRGAFWPTLGAGAVVLLLGPALLAAMAATVIGAPIALFIAALFVALVPLAFICVSYTLGAMLRARLAKREDAPALGPRVGWTLAGALLLTLLCALPFLGALLWLVALVSGLGAGVLSTRRALIASAASA